MKVYIIGPMRGLPFYNFPAFDAARDALVKCGHEVRSPADMDREIGFDAIRLGLSEPKDCAGVPLGFDLAACVRRDIEALLWCDAAHVLPGSGLSTGCAAEIAVAKWLGKPLWVAQ